MIEGLLPHSTHTGTFWLYVHNCSCPPTEFDITRATGHLQDSTGSRYSITPSPAQRNQQHACSRHIPTLVPSAKCRSSPSKSNPVSRKCQSQMHSSQIQQPFPQPVTTLSNYLCRSTHRACYCNSRPYWSLWAIPVLSQDKKAWAKFASSAPICFNKSTPFTGCTPGTQDHSMGHSPCCLCAPLQVGISWKFDQHASAGRPW